MRLELRKGDWLAVVAVLALAAVIFSFFLPTDAAGDRADIYINGQLVRSVSLSQDQEFEVEGKYRNTVTVKNGKIAVTDSDCPGKDCVHCGWSSASGKLIVCLPNGMQIRIVTDRSEVDHVVG